MSEESYIVRIYRKENLPVQMRRAEGSRRQHDRIALTGVIESAESGERISFLDVEGLWTALCSNKK